MLDFLLIQAAQLTHVVEGQLKVAYEEADKEKALKQVAEASLHEKTMGLNMMERWATTTEKALELAELKLAETANILSAQDEEFAKLKGGEKARK